MLENIDRSLAHKSAFAISGLIANGTIISVMKLSGLVRLTCLGDTDQLNKRKKRDRFYLLIVRRTDLVLEWINHRHRIDKYRGINHSVLTGDFCCFCRACGQEFLSPSQSMFYCFRYTNQARHHSSSTTLHRNFKKITFENIGHSCHVWTVAFWLHYVANA